MQHRRSVSGPGSGSTERRKSGSEGYGLFDESEISSTNSSEDAESSNTFRRDLDLLNIEFDMPVVSDPNVLVNKQNDSGNKSVRFLSVFLSFILFSKSSPPPPPPPPAGMGLQFPRRLTTRVRGLLSSLGPPPPARRGCSNCPHPAEIKCRN